MNNYIFINSANNGLVGVRLKDFDILMSEVGFFERLIREPKEKQESIVKKLISSEMDGFLNLYSYDSLATLKKSLEQGDNVIIYSAKKEALFYLNSDLAGDKLIDDEILVQLKSKIEGKNLFYNIIKGESSGDSGERDDGVFRNAESYRRSNDSRADSTDGAVYNSSSEQTNQSTSGARPGESGVLAISYRDDKGPNKDGERRAEHGAGVAQYLFLQTQILQRLKSLYKVECSDKDYIARFERVNELFFENRYKDFFRAEFIFYSPKSLQTALNIYNNDIIHFENPKFHELKDRDRELKSLKSFIDRLKSKSKEYLDEKSEKNSTNENKTRKKRR